jgi:hypothetical protein
LPKRKTEIDKIRLPQKSEIQSKAEGARVSKGGINTKLKVQNAK